MRVGLALLPADPDMVKPSMVEWMITAEDPREVEVARDVLAPWREDVKGDLWAKVVAAGTPATVRFRALVALAAFDPDDPRWHRANAAVIEPWLTADPLYLGVWTRALSPARNHLLGPLTQVFHGKWPTLASKRVEAASILARYLQDRPEALADLLADCDETQFGVILPALRAHGSRAVPLLERELKGRVHEPAQIGFSEREQRARRQANAAAALLLLQSPEAAWPLFQHRPDPGARTYLLHRIASLAVPARLLVERLDTEADVSARRALVLALGEFNADQLPAELRRRLVPLLLDWYEHDPDGGVHGAIDWLLRHGQEGATPRKLDWGQGPALKRIDNVCRDKKPGRGRRWYVNGQGQTLVIVPGPVEFDMGSPPGEKGRSDADELLHRRRIGRSFAIASKPVTTAEFHEFLKANPSVKHTGERSPNEPILVTWYEAAQYCQWLSEKEGLPEREWCYPSVAEIEKAKGGVTSLRMPADYLRRKGYRLPTEAEWEFACRAGAITSRYYGDSLDLLPDYAWYGKNAEDRTWPVGQKKPNDLGLFDMHGNVWNWCQESAWFYKPGVKGMPAEDVEDLRDLTDRLARVVRGGSYSNQPPSVRCAQRNFNRPSSRLNDFGLRPARTYQ
jgi:formylglycine-generating enzyme required for sulfatase activity